MTEYADRHFYHYRPRPIGGDIVVSQDDEAIYLATTIKSVKMAFNTVKSVRISFRPASLFLKKYIVTLRDIAGNKVSFSNVTFRGLAEQVDKNAEFDPFVHVLLTKLKAFNIKASSGEPPWLYYPVCVLCLGLTLMGLKVVVSSLAQPLWFSATMIVIFTYICYTMMQWVKLNKPTEMKAYG
jgi:hypothetical protein